MDWKELHEQKASIKPSQTNSSYGPTESGRTRRTERGSKPSKEARGKYPGLNQEPRSVERFYTKEERERVHEKSVQIKHWRPFRKSQSEPTSIPCEWKGRDISAARPDSKKRTESVRGGKGGDGQGRRRTVLQKSGAPQKGCDESGKKNETRTAEGASGCKRS